MESSQVKIKGGGPSPRKVWRALCAAAVVLVVLVGVAAAANAKLSDAYSPLRVVQEQFTAQARGDVQTMWRDSMFETSGASERALFSQHALEAMMAIPDNRKLSGLSHGAVRTDGSGTAHVDVKYALNGTPRSRTIELRQDAGQRHYLLYPAWRVVIPTAQVTVTVARHQQVLRIDGIDVNWSSAPISVMTGIHKVEVLPTTMLAGASQVIDATSGSAALSLPAQLNAEARAAAAAEVTRAFNSCDAATNDSCFGHVYQAPRDDYVYFLKVPGTGDVEYTQYVYNLKGDPTTAMAITVSNDPGVVLVHGECNTELVTDDSDTGQHRAIPHAGTFDGRLNWRNGTFRTEYFTLDC